MGCRAGTIAFHAERRHVSPLVRALARDFAGQQQPGARGIQRFLKNYTCREHRSIDLDRAFHYLASLSIWSPNPGVSTIVSEIRVPSSSSSNSGRNASAVVQASTLAYCLIQQPTNSDWLDLYTLFNMRGGWVVRVFVLEDFLATESVYECSSSWVMRPLALSRKLRWPSSPVTRTCS